MLESSIFQEYYSTLLLFHFTTSVIITPDMLIDNISQISKPWIQNVNEFLVKTGETNRSMYRSVTYNPILISHKRLAKLLDMENNCYTESGEVTTVFGSLCTKHKDTFATNSVKSVILWAHYTWNFKIVNEQLTNITFISLNLYMAPYLKKDATVLGEQVVINNIEYCGRQPPFTVLYKTKHLGIIAKTVKQNFINVHIIYQILPQNLVGEINDETNCKETYLKSKQNFYPLYRLKLMQKTNTLIYHLRSAKHCYIIISVTKNHGSLSRIKSFEGTVGLDGFKEWKAGEQITTHSFQITILLLHTDKENMMLEFSKVPHPYFSKHITNDGNNSMSIELPDILHCHKLVTLVIPCIVVYNITTLFERRVNVTFEFLSYDGYNDGICSFAGVALGHSKNSRFTKPNETEVVEMVSLCTNISITKIPSSLSYVSNGSHVLVVIYIFPQDVNSLHLHASFQISSSDCNVILLDPCTKHNDVNIAMNSAVNEVRYHHKETASSPLLVCSFCKTWNLMDVYLKKRLNECVVIQTSGTDQEPSEKCYMVRIFRFQSETPIYLKSNIFMYLWTFQSNEKRTSYGHNTLSRALLPGHRV